MKETNVYEHANDQHVRALVVYAKAADSKLYYESDYKTQVTKADAEKWFTMNSLVIKTVTGYAVPVAVDGVKVTTVAKSGSAVAATEWTVATAV